MFWRLPQDETEVVTPFNKRNKLLFYLKDFPNFLSKYFGSKTLHLCKHITRYFMFRIHNIYSITYLFLRCCCRFPVQLSSISTSNQFVEVCLCLQINASFMFKYIQILRFIQLSSILFEHITQINHCKTEILLIVQNNRKTRSLWPD